MNLKSYYKLLHSLTSNTIAYISYFIDQLVILMPFPLSELSYKSLNNFDTIQCSLSHHICILNAFLTFSAAHL